MCGCPSLVFEAPQRPLEWSPRCRRTSSLSCTVFRCVCLTKVIKGVGGLSHAEWRSFHNERKTVESKAFIDGDLVEAFLDLKRERMAEVAEQMKVPLEELCKKVEELTRLH
ncbi:unnamed protein product [Closterium sp. NIES-54]